MEISEDKSVKITQKNPTQFVFESTHELETYFMQTRFFYSQGKRYELNGNPIAIQAAGPDYSFVYAVEVKPVE